MPEPVEKALLRAKSDVSVFKDGTLRFDASNAVLTQFRPGEIGLSLEKAREIGYMQDMDGRELSDPRQLCALQIQDLVVSEACGEYLLKVTRFLDDLLNLYYGMDKLSRSSRNLVTFNRYSPQASETTRSCICRAHNCLGSESSRPSMSCAYPISWAFSRLSPISPGLNWVRTAFDASNRRVPSLNTETSDFARNNAFSTGSGIQVSLIKPFTPFTDPSIFPSLSLPTASSSISTKFTLTLR